MTRASFSIFIAGLLFITSGGSSLSADVSTENENHMEGQDQTSKDLHYAFVGECQANRKYTAFAEAADQQGFPEIARLWRAAAAAEAIHAKNHMKVLGMIKSTEQNLQGAVEGEQYEFQTMYPKFIKTAQDAGKPEAAKSMDWAFRVELQEDLDDLKKGQHPKDVAYWVCGVCGNTVPKNPPEKCEICDSPKSKFFEIK